MQSKETMLSLKHQSRSVSKRYQHCRCWNDSNNLTNFFQITIRVERYIFIIRHEEKEWTSLKIRLQNRDRIIKIRFVKKEKESFIISIACQIRENHLRRTSVPWLDEKRRRRRRWWYFVRSLPRAGMQICGAHVFVRGWHAHARTCPRRDKGAYGRLTVAARHTYLMDFRRYAVGRAYTHANPAVQISPRKRSRFLSRRAILSSPSSTSSSSSFPLFSKCVQEFIKIRVDSFIVLNWMRREWFWGGFTVGRE